jgi:hypothetical protein
VLPAGSQEEILIPFQELHPPDRSRRQARRNGTPRRPHRSKLLHKALNLPSSTCATAYHRR